MYTQFKVDSAYVGYNTNVCIAKSNAGKRLLFRTPGPNKAFEVAHFKAAYNNRSDPELIDVARHVTDLDKLNLEKDFKPLVDHTNPSCIDRYRNKPWFRLLNQFLLSVPKDNPLYQA